MNTKLLRQIKEHILAEPKRLYMGEWIRRKTHPNQMIMDREYHYREFAGCDTAACIAGWAVLLSSPKPDSVGQLGGVSEQATNLLDLSQDSAYRLFAPRRWPEQFWDGTKDDGTRHTAQVAAARIEHFISTEGAE